MLPLLYMYVPYLGIIFGTFLPKVHNYDFILWLPGTTLLRYERTQHLARLLQGRAWRSDRSLASPCAR